MTFCDIFRTFKSPVSLHFRRSYLKANKVSKSEGTNKVEYAYNFQWGQAEKTSLYAHCRVPPPGECKNLCLSVF